MKDLEKKKAIALRKQGFSIGNIANKLGVSKSSVSLWVREVILSDQQIIELSGASFTSAAIEKRRVSRLANEHAKRELVIKKARGEVLYVTERELWLMGVMLYWAEGGKTQRLVRFSNGDPDIIITMMEFFRRICKVPEQKFRGYIHIHPHLDASYAERYWSEISGIPISQFFKTYRKINKSSKGKRDTLPQGVFDVYVMDTELFLRITGWSRGIFDKSKRFY